ncbi:hypothetical protein [Methanoculleus bourgensis]|uniref:Uncharacterized protein n=1 Tax=Methanoculleus bourgensis TaxID=83986 RepID=A0A0X3BHH4_9EURY|nr:hypothetical protein [Methanoculleus bourgensis]CVK31240.1 protein of unknown function [Methanoculleus bourgensis]
MLAAAGVTDRAAQGRVLAAELASGGLSTLHERIATPRGVLLCPPVICGRRREAGRGRAARLGSPGNRIRDQG